MKSILQTIIDDIPDFLVDARDLAVIAAFGIAIAVWAGQFSGAL